MLRTVEMDFNYQQYIPGPPSAAKNMYKQACANDKVTIGHWRDTWVNHARENHKNFGPFAENSIGSLYGKYARQPMIVAGAGPGLKNNIEDLKDTKGIPIVSCLHNFHFLIDNDVKNIEAFVTLDAGHVTIEEVYEGGKHEPDYYWDKTKNYTLLAFVGTHPDLLKKWQGEIKFFKCPVGDEALIKAMDEIEEFYTYVSTGGNVLGACAYISRMMGANPLVFVGADFCFDYKSQFHAWDSKYDKNKGQCIRSLDVWGNSVLTWQSYYNFKTWFDWLASNVLGIYINCTESGLLGAYKEGNIMQIKQMLLKDLVKMYSLYENAGAGWKEPTKKDNHILF